MIPALKKLLRRDPEAGASSNTLMRASVQGAGGVQEEYAEAVAENLRQMGVSCTAVEPRSCGFGPKGREKVAVIVRVTHFERPQVLRVFMGLPLLEARVREIFADTWISEVSEFEGIWLQASGEGWQAEELGQMRELIHRLELAR